MITGQLFLFEMPKRFETPAWMQIRAYVTSRWAFPVIYSDLSVFAPLKRPAYVVSLVHSIYLSVCLSIIISFYLSSFVRSFCHSFYLSVVLSLSFYVCLSVCHLWKSCTAILTIKGNSSILCIGYLEILRF